MWRAEQSPACQTERFPPRQTLRAIVNMASVVLRPPVVAAQATPGAATFIIERCRKIASVGGSLRRRQMLAANPTPEHARVIDGEAEAQGRSSS